MNPDVKTVAANTNDFAFDLFGRLSSGNVFFSPTSLSTALAMAYAGAAGETAEEMAKTLHFSLPPQRLHPAYAALVRLLNDAGAPPAYQISVANALWTQRGFPLLAPFLETLKRDYGAGEHAVDFENETEEARQTINRWVEQQTRDRIKNLIARGDLTPDARLVLTNAVYFKGDWLLPFEYESTRVRAFETKAGNSIQVNMMHQKSMFDYGENDTAQWLEMPYKGGDLSMMFILPKKRHQLSLVEKELSTATLQKWVAGAKPEEVMLALPKFRMDTSFELARTLAQMGMPQAFDIMRANFTGMANVPGAPLYIGAVIHKAFVQVDELGTEAAAATAIIMRVGSAAAAPKRPKEFTCDQPFLCVLRDRRSGAVLFLGRVSEPTPAKS